MSYTLYTHERVRDLPRLSRRGFPPETFFSTDLSWIVEDAMHESAREGMRHVVIQVDAPEDVLGVTDKDIESALYEDETPEEGAPVWEEVPEDSEEGRYEAGEAEYYEEPEEEYEEEYEEEEEDEADDEEPTFHAFTGTLNDGQTLTVALPLMPDGQVDRVYADPEELAQYDEMVANGDVEEAEELDADDDEEEGEEEVDEDWPTSLHEAIELTESATLIKRLPPEAALVLGEAGEVFDEDLTDSERAADIWYRFPIEPRPLVEFQSPFWGSLLRKIFKGY